MATTAAIVAIAGTVATTVSQLTKSSGGGGSTKLPTPPSQDLTQSARQLLPGTTANAAANVGGGMGPEFIQNLISGQTGPGGGLDILGDIQKALGNTGPGGTPPFA